MAKKAKISGGKDIHVLPTAKGEWAIKAGGSPKPLKLFSSKNAATAYAKNLVAKPNKTIGAKAGKKAKGALSSVDVYVHTKAIFEVKHTSKGKVSKVVSKTKAVPQFGSAKGKFVLSPDFDETPEDFHDYVE